MVAVARGRAYAWADSRQALTRPRFNARPRFWRRGSGVLRSCPCSSVFHLDPLKDAVQRADSRLWGGPVLFLGGFALCFCIHHSYFCIHPGVALRWPASVAGRLSPFIL